MPSDDTQTVSGLDPEVDVELEVPPAHHATDSPVVFDIDGLSVYYGGFRAVRDVSLQVHEHEITAFIGPSGCGKTTVLRCLNRMNDLIETAQVEGSVRYHGIDLYDRDVNPVEVRRRIGMVFQKPNPFPKSMRRCPRSGCASPVSCSTSRRRVTTRT